MKSFRTFALTSMISFTAGGCMMATCLTHDNHRTDAVDVDQRYVVEKTINHKTCKLSIHGMTAGKETHFDLEVAAERPPAKVEMEIISESTERTTIAMNPGGHPGHFSVMHRFVHAGPHELRLHIQDDPGAIEFATEITVAEASHQTEHGDHAHSARPAVWIVGAAMVVMMAFMLGRNGL